MKPERQHFVEWLQPLLVGLTTQTLLLEPDQDWTPPCWRLWTLAEDGVAPGHWSLMLQLDYYRSDGDTVAALQDCDALLKSMGFAQNMEAIVSVPRSDGSGKMSLTLSSGSWRPGPVVTVSPLDRHYVLTLELGFPRR